MQTASISVREARVVAIVETSPHCLDEKRYVLDWLFGEVFGLEHKVVVCGEANGITVGLNNHHGSLTIQGRFLEQPDEDWLSSESIPILDKVQHRQISTTRRHGRADSIVDLFPVANANETIVGESPGVLSLRCDVMGSLFFLMSRYEEAILSTRDDHDRFPSDASTLGKLGIVNRAIGNEYIELLWACMKRLWPSIERKSRTFRLIPSHDIDSPLMFQGLKRPARILLGDVVRRKDPSLFLNNSASWVRHAMGDSNADPHDQIDWLMDQSEAVGVSSAFNYIPENTHRLDQSASVQHPRVGSQWKRIHKRGHEIGLHPGYETYLSPELVASGADQIRRQLLALCIDQTSLGGRQHYLRWKTPETARHWESANLSYDSTLGYADQPGFRCGVCYEFPLYDVIERRPMRLRERPLVAMDATVMADHYLGLGTSDEAYDCLVRLKEECRRYHGDYTLLWHNTELLTDEKRELYRSVLRA